ncbi:hypothetical protein EYF80_007543 [Liparis tanakae]|uniref:Uncharacterized protein n=1 Tax=Liparis tanakae TaxID=230148 RepID=A0A4Z2IW35_9TELE|nr:hypothetical protein EYF80_007543 [Liparis tanakae]
MDRLKGHDLGFVGVSLLENLSEMGDVIVAENKFLHAAVLDAHDHGGVVARIRHLGKGEEGGVVGDEAGGEEQCSVLLVKVGQFQFKFHMELTGPRDVPGASGPRPMLSCYKLDKLKQENKQAHLTGALWGLNSSVPTLTQTMGRNTQVSEPVKSSAMGNSLARRFTVLNTRRVFRRSLFSPPLPFMLLDRDDCSWAGDLSAKGLTFIDRADFLDVLLELHADLADHTAVLLAHLSSQKRAFGGHRLT